MSNQADVDGDNLFKLYVLLQDLMNQHMIIDETVKNLSVSEGQVDLEQLDSAATAIISLCKEIEEDFNPTQKSVAVLEAFRYI